MLFVSYCEPGTTDTSLLILAAGRTDITVPFGKEETEGQRMMRLGQVLGAKKRKAEPQNQESWLVLLAHLGCAHNLCPATHRHLREAELAAACLRQMGKLRHLAQSLPEPRQ